MPALGEIRVGRPRPARHPRYRLAAHRRRCKLPVRLRVGDSITCRIASGSSTGCAASSSARRPETATPWSGSLHGNGTRPACCIPSSGASRAWTPPRRVSESARKSANDRRIPKTRSCKRMALRAGPSLKVLGGGAMCRLRQWAFPVSCAGPRASSSPLARPPTEEPGRVTPAASFRSCATCARPSLRRRWCGMTAASIQCETSASVSTYVGGYSGTARSSR